MSTSLDIVVCQDCVLLPAYSANRWACIDESVGEDILCCECGDACEFVAYLLTPVKKG